MTVSPRVPKLTAREDPDWQSDASCAQIGGDLWFGETNRELRNARAVCESCPVIEQCLAFALVNVEQWGMWAGRTPRELRKMRQAVA